MSHFLIKLSGLSLAIAAIIGVLRFKKISQVYVSFIILLWVGLANEGLNWIILSKGFSNTINGNIFFLVEAVLILLFLKANGLFEEKRIIFYVLIILYLVVWITELFIIRSIHEFSSYFIILYAFSTVIMSINMISKMNTTDYGAKVRGPLFLIFICFIAYYTYSVLLEIFWIYGLNASNEFRIQVYRILTYINLCVNIVYALALSWIPKKRESLLQ